MCTKSEHFAKLTQILVSLLPLRQKLIFAVCKFAIPRLSCSYISLTYYYCLNSLWQTFFYGLSLKLATSVLHCSHFRYAKLVELVHLPSRFSELSARLLTLSPCLFDSLLRFLPFKTCRVPRSALPQYNCHFLWLPTFGCIPIFLNRFETHWKRNYISA